jgi:hypothetical protein
MQTLASSLKDTRILVPVLVVLVGESGPGELMFLYDWFTV